VSEDPVGSLDVAVPLLDLFTVKRIMYHRDNEQFLQPWDKIETAPLRFTWEFELPSYYYGNSAADNGTAAVVISDDAEQELPAYVSERLSGYQLARIYDTYEGIFRFKTTVRIYQRTR
jgi:hypothetical protein